MFSTVSASLIRSVLSLSIVLFCCTTVASFGFSPEFENAANLFGNGKFEEALTYFDKTVDAEPTNGEYHYWRARCLAELGKTKEATAEFKVALLLTTEEKTRSSCKEELAKVNQAIPAGSVEAALKPAVQKVEIKALGRKMEDAPDKAPVLEKNKPFKLSSRKLDWNLTMTKEFQNKMVAGNRKLESLAAGTRWSLPPSAQRSFNLDIASELAKGPAHAIGNLSDWEKLALSSADIMIVLDRSGSMQASDCPSGSSGYANASGAQSRLGWCVEEIEAFAQTLTGKLPHGFTFITFDSKPESTRITNAQSLHNAIDNLHGGGGTDLAAALKEAFRLHSAHPNQPLLIALVTDAEIDVRSSEEALREGARRFPLPNGVFITLLQIGIGAEAHTADTLSILDDLPNKSGVAYDCVDTIPFSQLRRDGFGRDILLGLRRNTPSKISTGNAAAPAPAPAPTPDKKLRTGEKGTSSVKH